MQVDPHEEAPARRPHKPPAALVSSKTPRPPRALDPGRRSLPARLDRYTLFSHIGRGGMADIYLASAATELGASRLVVIKEVLPDLAHSKHFADMLVSEAKLAARLEHANVVKVEDLGRDGTLYIAMEYVEGVDLREMLRRCAKSKIPVPVEFSLRVVAETLKALSYAHRFRGESGAACPIIHRDVSPSNVLLSFEGEVKLCDFGIARANALAEPAADEAIQGKAGYMSPEQARGEALDPRADVYAAGIVLWELLAGRRLYKANEGEALLDVAKRAERPELPARGLPDEARLHAIVDRALERGRDARYASAAAMLADLEDYTLSARLVASPLRFGAWLAEHFGAEVWGPRRAGERVLRALAKGPAARLEPLTASKVARNAAGDAAAACPSVSALSLAPGEEMDAMTPSTFGVVERAIDPIELDVELPKGTLTPITPRAAPLSAPRSRTVRGAARLLMTAVVLFALAAALCVLFGR